MSRVFCNFSISRSDADIMSSTGVWFEVGYSILRTFGLLVFTAEINEQSRRPLRVFWSVPREGWCLEVKRFNSEVSRDTVALTAMDFFKFTRKLLPTVAGTIASYELVSLLNNILN